MQSRMVSTLLLLAVTAAVFVAFFGSPRPPGGQPLAPARDTQVVELPGAFPQVHAGPDESSLEGPAFLTRFDIALLVLGGLGLTGLCRRVPGLVGATPLGVVPRLRTRVTTRRWSGLRCVPPIALGILLMTAATAVAQTEPSSPYVGNPPNPTFEGNPPTEGNSPSEGNPPYVGNPPSEGNPTFEGNPITEVGAPVYAGIYVDALPPATTGPERSTTMAVVGPALARTPGAAEPATLRSASEDPTGPEGGTPVTAADAAGLAVLLAAALAVLLVPRWRGR